MYDKFNKIDEWKVILKYLNLKNLIFLLFYDCLYFYYLLICISYK